MPDDNGLHGHGLILVPQKPSLRTICLGDRNGHNFVRKTLFFPHSMFCMFYGKHLVNEYRPEEEIQLKRCHVVFGKTPFTGNPEEKFFGLPLRNHEVAHGICFYNWPSDKTIQGLAKQVIAQYWASPYIEYGDNFSHWTQAYNASGFFAKWEEATKKKNYDWIYDQNLLAAPYIVDLQKLLDANKSQYAKGGISVIELEKPNLGNLLLKDILVENKLEVAIMPTVKKIEEKKKKISVKILNKKEKKKDKDSKKRVYSINRMTPLGG